MGPLCRAGARPGRSRLSTGRTPQSFALAEATGHAAEFAGWGRGEPPPGRLLVIRRVVDRAVVLGSTQSDDEVDEAAAARIGASVTRRQSGGGAVLVAPQAQVWADLFLPAGDPLLERDLGRSFAWLGRAWARALESLGVSDPVVTGPGKSPRPFERQLCFAGRGAGEVLVAGRKVVGISQRRRREGAFFFSMLELTDKAPDLVSCLRLPEEERAAALEELRTGSGWLPLEERTVEEALASALP